MNVLNHILQSVGYKGKHHLTQGPASPYLKLVFKAGAVETIKHAKGWKTDADLARALGVTRAYVSMLAKRRVSVSHNVILRLAYLMNNTASWWHFYEIVDTGQPVDPNHPLWNEEKYQGTIPYRAYSSSAEARKEDYQVERN